MREMYVVLFALILLSVAVSPAGASGEEEKDPVFNLKQTGWQSVTLHKGFDLVKRTDARFYHAYVKSISGMTKEKLDILTRDFLGPAFELYAATGTGFTLRREEGAGWKATLVALKENAALSLLRAMVYKTEDFGDNRLVTYKVKAYDRPLPMWRDSGHSRYVFRGVWNMSPAELPPNGVIDLVIMRVLERMAAELGPGEGPSLLSGRLYLLEYRFLYISRDRLGLYCRLAVERE